MQTEDFIVPGSSSAETKNVCEEKESNCETTESESESKLLESRLDEQTNLIMIIKTRCEDTDVKCKALKEENLQLTYARDKMEKKLEEQGKNLSEFTEKLKTLQEEHDELLVTINDLKYDQEQLVKERSSLLSKSENLHLMARNEAQIQIESLIQTHMDLEDQCVKLKRSISTETKEMEIKRKQYRNSIASLKYSHHEEIKELMDNLHLKKFAFQETERALKKEEEEYINGLPIPEDVLKLEVRHKSLTHEDNIIHRELMIEQLKTKDTQKVISELRDKVDEMNTTFDQKAAEAQANPAVQDLYLKINEAKEQFVEMQKEIEEFKKESQEKLQVEREINQKLRHIH